MSLPDEYCIDCFRGFYDECGHEAPDRSDMTISFSDKPEGRVGGYKDAADLKDPASTGRKEAAKLYPIIEGTICEWANLANVGGGKYPIVGCRGNKAKHIHHGPDKTTTNNVRSNIHLICGHCHTLWHAQNDADHDATIKHDPRPATEVELRDWNELKNYVKRNR